MTVAKDKGTDPTLEEMLFQMYGKTSRVLTPEEVAHLGKLSEERKQRRQAEGRKAEQEDT